MTNQIQTASEVKNSIHTSTLAHETRKKVLNYLVIVAIAVAAAFTSCGGGGNSGGGGFSNAKWEYMVLDGRADGSSRREELNKNLNELGAQGWELVSSGLSYASNTGDLYLIFKRKL